MGLHAAQHGGDGVTEVLARSAVNWAGSEPRIRAQSLHRYLPPALQMLFPSSKSWQRALDAGQIARGAQPVSRATWIQKEDTLSVRGAGQPETLVPWPSGWIYGFQEPELAIVWKPAGMPTSGVGGQNLAAQLPGHPVHRLDRDTSGWVLVSQSHRTTVALHHAFAAGKIDKTYLALASGACPQQLDIRLPLNGKRSQTTCLRLAQGAWPICGEATLLEVTLLTGRTHQIRRHLHAIGHGIVGDPIYLNSPERFTGSGLFLSCVRMAFDHPGSGERIVAEAPPPRKFRRIRWWQG